MSPRDRNRFVSFRGILTGRVDSNSRVDYFLHVLHDKWIIASGSKNARNSFKKVKVQGKLRNTAMFNNSAFINTMECGELCQGLDNALSYEFLMFLSDVSAHLNAVQKGTAGNKDAFQNAITEILKLSPTVAATADKRDRVSKGFLLKFLFLICSDITTSEKGKLNSSAELYDFVGVCTGFTMKPKDQWVEGFCGLFGSTTTGWDGVEARIGTTKVATGVGPVGFQTQYATGQWLDYSTLGLNGLASLTNPSAAAPGINQAVADASNATFNAPAGSVTFLDGTSLNAAEMGTLTGPGITLGLSGTAPSGVLDIPDGNIKQAVAQNMPTKMRVTDTHPALFWEHKNLWKRSSTVSGDVNCDLKKHYVATIALAGGIRKDADSLTDNEKRGISPHYPLLTSDKFPDPVIHVTASHFVGGDGRTQFQWTSALSKMHQVWLVMFNSTDDTAMSIIKTNSQQKWSGKGADLMNSGTTAWGASQLAGAFDRPRPGATNYPASFHFPAVFDQLAADKGGDNLTSNKGFKDGDFFGYYADNKIDSKVDELIGFYNASKSITDAYDTACVEQESTFDMFSTNVNRLVQEMLRGNAVLPIPGSSGTVGADDDDYTPKGYTRNDMGELTDSDGNLATVDNYAALGKLTATPSCFTLGPVSGANAGKCNNFMMGCLGGKNIAECKNFMMDPDFWSAQSDDVDNMMPQLGHTILERFGVEKDSDGNYEPVEDWIKHLSKSSSKLGLSAADVGAIANNDKLTTWLRRVVTKMNSLPDTQVSASNSLANSWLVRQAGLTVKKAGVTSQVTPLDQLVRYIHQRRRALRVHLFGTPGAVAVGLLGGGADENTDMELMAYNARQQVYNSLNVLKSTFHMFKDSLETKGKEIDPNDLQEIEGEFNAQKKATDKLIKYIEYMEKYAVLKEMYGVQDPSGKVIGKDGMRLLIQKNQAKFKDFVSQEDSNIEIIRKVQDLLEKLE